MFSVEIVDEDIGVEVGVIVVGVHQPVLYLASTGVLGEVLPDGHPPQAQGQPRTLGLTEVSLSVRNLDRVSPLAQMFHHLVIIPIKPDNLSPGLRPQPDHAPAARTAEVTAEPLLRGHEAGAGAGARVSELVELGLGGCGGWVEAGLGAGVSGPAGHHAAGLVATQAGAGPRAGAGAGTGGWVS